MRRHESSLNANTSSGSGWKTSLIIFLLSKQYVSNAFLVPGVRLTALPYGIRGSSESQHSWNNMKMSLDSNNHRIRSIQQRQRRYNGIVKNSRPKARQSLQAKPKQTKILSRDEQLTLLKQYGEYRRIRSILAAHESDSWSVSQRASLCDCTPSHLSKVLMDGPNSRESLLLHNLPLIRSIVYKCTTNMELKSLTHQDLIQEGILGLASAIEKFDVEMAERQDIALSTYATYWIRASVRRAIAKSDELIRVPEHVNSVLGKLSKTEAVQHDQSLNYSSQGSRSSTGLNVKDLAKEVDVSESMMRNALEVKARRQTSSRKGNYVALEDWMTTRQSKGSPTSNWNGLTVERDHEREGQLEYVKETLARFLSGKEMEALSWRYGLVEEATNNLTQKAVFGRDYEAEAEEELFGKSVIVTSSSEVMPGKKVRLIQSRRNQVPLSKSVVKPSVNSKGGRWGEAMSFKEVGEQMRVSAEYGRRLCSSAMKKLKEAADEGRLDPGMLF